MKIANEFHLNDLRKLVACAIMMILVSAMSGCERGSVGDLKTAVAAKSAIKLVEDPPKLSPSTLDFRTVAIAQEIAPRTVEISNQKGGPIFIAEKQDFGAEFSINTTDCLALADGVLEGASCKIVVEFFPSREQAIDRKTEVHYTRSRDPGAPFESIDLNILAQVTAASISSVQVVPSEYAFGSSVESLQTKSATFVISNNSLRNYRITSISADGVAYNITSTTCPAPAKEFKSREQCDVTVMFKPQFEGGLIGKLLVNYADDVNRPPTKVTATLSGTGLSQRSIGASALSLTPMAHDFGLVAVGARSATKAIKLVNTQLVEVYIGAFEVIGADFNYLSDDCPKVPASLAPGKSCLVNLAYSPTTGGKKTGILQSHWGLLAGSIDYVGQASLAGKGVSKLNFLGLTSVGNATSSTLELNWTPSAEATSYYVFDSSASAGLRLLATLTAASSSYLVTSLTPNTAYTYLVRATDQLGVLEDNTEAKTATTQRIGTFAAIAAATTTEGAAFVSSALSCSDEYGHTPTLQVLSTSNVAARCTFSSATMKVSCVPDYVAGHLTWSTTLAMACTINGSTLSRDFVVNVNDTNRAPVLDAIANQSAVAGTAFNLIDAGQGGVDVDQDTDALLYTCTFSGGGFTAGTSCASLPGTVTFGTSTGQLAYTPSLAAATTVNVPFTVVISAGDQQATPLSSSLTVVLTVIPASPLLNTPGNLLFPSAALVQGAAFSFDFANSRTNDDVGMSYACSYDRTVDAAVASGSACTSLPGTASFNTATGLLSWTSNTSSYGPYEIKVVGTNSVGSDTKVFVIDIRPPYTTTNLLGSYDSQFAASSGGQGVNTPTLTTTIEDLTGTLGSHQGVLTGFGGSAASGWVGTLPNSTSNQNAAPYALVFDGTDDYVDLGTSLNTSSTMAVEAWVYPGENQRCKVIMSNSDAALKGFTLRHGCGDSAQIEMIVGGSAYDQAAYTSLVLADGANHHYPLNENSGGTVLDYGASNSNGSYGGTKYYRKIVGPLGDATNFINSSATVSPAFAFANNYTFETMFYTPMPATCATSTFCNLYTSLSSPNIALGFGAGIPSMRANSSITVRNTDSLYNVSTLADGWHHYAALGNGTNTQIYIDGTNVGAIPYVLTDSVSMIANAGTSGSSNYAGAMSNATFYTTNIASAKIVNHANAAIGNRCQVAVPDNVWSHVVGSYNSGTGVVEMYYNGVKQCSRTTVTAPALSGSSQSILIGRDRTGSAQSWLGRLGEVRLYSSISDANVLANFNATSARYNLIPTQPPKTSLVNWFRADQGLFQDSALTTAALLNNDPVGGWTDIMGTSASSNLINGTASRRPTLDLTSGPNGTPQLIFDGVDDFISNTLDYGASSGGAGGAGQFFVLGQYKGTVHGRIFNGSSMFWYLGWYLDAIGCWYPNTAMTTSGCTSTSLSNFLFSGSKEGTFTSVHQNGVAILARTENTANVFPVGIRLGSGQGNVEFSNAGVSEVLYYSRTLPDNIRKAVEAYINGRYAIW